MKIVNVTRRHPSIIRINTSFVLNFKHSKEIWLFNCSQGCQHMMEQQGMKISQISRIIITELTIDNISGLLGLLSSLSLINRKKVVDIYSLEGLEKYLEFGKKYSQTNFRYNLYFHMLNTGLIINNDHYQMYTFVSRYKLELFIISKEEYGKFNLIKAKDFNLIPGPLYGKLKKGGNFLLPDGLVINGYKLTNCNNLGYKVSFLLDKYYRRTSLEISNVSKILHSTLILYKYD